MRRIPSPLSFLTSNTHSVLTTDSYYAYLQAVLLLKLLVSESFLTIYIPNSSPVIPVRRTPTHSWTMNHPIWTWHVDLNSVDGISWFPCNILGLGILHFFPGLNWGIVPLSNLPPGQKWCCNNPCESVKLYGRSNVVLLCQIRNGWKLLTNSKLCKKHTPIPLETSRSVIHIPACCRE